MTAADHNTEKNQAILAQTALYPTPNPARKHNIARYFGPHRLPGTTAIGFRKTHPELFQDTLDSPFETYPDWVGRSIRKILTSMNGDGFPNAFDDDAQRRIVRKTMEMLESPTADGTPLHDEIPQQMYEDVFIRLVALAVGLAPTAPETHAYAALNALCRRIGLQLIDRMADRSIIGGERPDIPALIRAAVLSGHVGINLKSTASAASALLNRDLIPLDQAWVHDPETARSIPTVDLDDIARHLLDLTEAPQGRFGLDSLSQYRAEVVDASDPTLMVFFCDDYLESMIDMKRFAVMLARNPRLTLLFAPRAGRYGNDLAHSDVAAILEDPRFRDFDRLHRDGRIRVSEHGPRAGCLDPRNMSSEFIEAIETLGQGRRIIFETKGCRNFEMLQGRLTVPWYAAFNCNRALSIRTVGVDGPPVFLRIPPGLRAYDGFTTPRIGQSPSYRTAGVRFARMTTRQLYTALASQPYRRLRERLGDELKLNTTLDRRSAEGGLTFSELMDLFSAHPETFSQFQKEILGGQD